MSPANAVLAALGRDGLEAEVYRKRGRSRRIEVAERGGGRAQLAVEEGWAIRAGGARGAFFLAGTGEPPTAGPWPALAGGALRLPAPVAAEPWRAPAALDTPLLSESEGRALLEGLSRELGRELPDARLLAALLEDGASESQLVASTGIDASWRQRGAWLRAEAALGPARATLEVVERNAQALAPRALARRLADLLHVLAAERAADRDRGTMLIAPPLAARLLAALLPALVGPTAAPLLAQLGDVRGRVATDAVTIVDDGRLEGGILAAPCDGEGLPTGRVVLVERGIVRQPLLAWWQVAAGASARPSGCARRASWRDVPRPGPTQLYLEPREDRTVAQLLAAVARGFYLLDAVGAVRIDFPRNRFAVPVCGFAVQDGRALAPVSRAWLAGAISALLLGIEGVGRDLTFLPLDGLIGSPSLLVGGLELRPAP